MDYNIYTEQSRNNLVALQENSEYTEIKNVFIELAKVFEKAEVKWALACSMNLFCRGIVDDFHDIDLIVDSRSIDKIKTEMSIMGAELVATGGNGFCESDVYLHYRIGRVDIDIISGFRLNTFNTTYYYKYNCNEIDYDRIFDIKVPMISMEALYVLYYMMEGWQPRRRFKRVLIEDFLTIGKGKFLHPEVLKRAIRENELPSPIKYAVKKLLEE